MGDQRAANRAAERALALAETDRPVLPFAMTDSRQLLMALPSHDTAHAALLAKVYPVVDAIAGTSRLRPGKQRRDGCKLAVGRSR